MAIKIISIDDFIGGRENFREQALLPGNVCSSASLNVWAPDGSLTKAPGMVNSSSPVTSSGDPGINNFANALIFDESITSSFQIFISMARINSASIDAPVGGYLHGSAMPLSEGMTLLGYGPTLSTIRTSGVSATGIASTWSTNITANNDVLIVTGNSGGAYLVKSVEDDTHLTLYSPAPATNVTAAARYIIGLGLSAFEVGYASLNGILCASTTADAMQRYNGTDIQRMASAPAAAFLATHKNYMFAARTGANPSRLRWSAIKDPTTWPTNNFVDVDLQNAGPISGIFSFGADLIVFKTRGMYRVVGDIFDPSNPTYQIVKIQTPSDFLFNSHRSCATHKGRLTFYGIGKIYQYASGTHYITDISPYIIRDMPTTFSNIYDSLSNAEQRVYAIEFRDHYIIKGISSPTGASVDAFIALVLDPSGVWWLFNNDNASGTTGSSIFGDINAAVVPSTTARPVLTILNRNGRVFTWDYIGPSYGTNFYAGGATNGAVAIDGQWVSKEFNIEYGTFKWIVIYLKKQSAGNLTVKWSVDQAASVSYTQDMTKGRGQIIRARIPIMQKGSTIQLTLSNNTASQTFRIYGIKIYYEQSELEGLL